MRHPDIVYLEMAGNDKEEMGEEAIAPDSTNHEETENISEEYNMLDSKLDELNSALDFLEQKNDNIHAQLVELLHSSREIREQLRQEQTASQDAPAPVDSKPDQQHNNM